MNVKVSSLQKLTSTLEGASPVAPRDLGVPFITTLPIYANNFCAQSFSFNGSIRLGLAVTNPVVTLPLRNLQFCNTLRRKDLLVYTPRTRNLRRARMSFAVVSF